MQKPASAGFLLPLPGIEAGRGASAPAAPSCTAWAVPVRAAKTRPVRYMRQKVRQVVDLIQRHTRHRHGHGWVMAHVRAGAEAAQRQWQVVFALASHAGHLLGVLALVAMAAQAVQALGQFGPAHHALRIG